MVYRKGELSKSQVDMGWPHQVALPEDRCSLKNYEIHAAFNKGLSLCARGHSVSFDGVWYRVFCYSLKEDAEAFLARFGGEWFDPDQRGKGVNWMRYKGKLSGRPAACEQSQRAPSK
jgi:hypothetical protein